MAVVERGNVVLRVEEFEVERYLKLGYNETDEEGNIIQRAVPNDLGTLRKAYIENTARIKELEDELEELKAKNKAAKKSTKKEQADE